MWNRFSPRLRKLIIASTEVAGVAGYEEVAAEHLVLALVRDADSAARFVVEQIGINPQGLIESLEQLPRGSDAPRQRAVRMSAVAMHLLDVAIGESGRLGHQHVGTEHVIVAISKARQSSLGELLCEMGFTAEKADAAVRCWSSEGVHRRSAGKKSGRTSRLFRRVPTRVKKALSLPLLAWKVFGRKSLAHPKFVSDPYPLYRWLREHEPVRHDPIAPVWVLTRYADVAMILKDSRFRKDPFAAERLPRAVREQLAVPAAEVARSDVETVSMLFLDPPQHTRVRSLFSKAFTPRMIENLRPRIQQIADRRLDAVIASGRMDVIDALAYPLPIIVIAELLGFPPEDYARFKKWSDDFAAALALDAKIEQLHAAGRSRDELRVYFDDLVQKLSKSPGENLISAFIAMEREPGGLSREELFINSILLLAAGHETTTNLIGNSLLALLQHPDQLQLLVDSPELIESAVEELLRFDAAVQWVSRVVAEPLEIGGVQLEPGALILGSLGAANRDPEEFTEPDRLDIRRVANRHLSLGAGTHYCLGASLARMEAQIAIGTMVSRLKHLRLDEKKLRWKKGLTFRALETLRVRFDP